MCEKCNPWEREFCETLKNESTSIEIFEDPESLPSVLNNEDTSNVLIVDGRCPPDARDGNTESSCGDGGDSWIGWCAAGAHTQLLFEHRSRITIVKRGDGAHLGNPLTGSCNENSTSYEHSLVQNGLRCIVFQDEVTAENAAVQILNNYRECQNHAKSKLQACTSRLPRHNVVNEIVAGVTENLKRVIRQEFSVVHIAIGKNYW